MTSLTIIASLLYIYIYDQTHSFSSESMLTSQYKSGGPPSSSWCPGGERGNPYFLIQQEDVRSYREFPNLLLVFDHGGGRT